MRFLRWIVLGVLFLEASGPLSARTLHFILIPPQASGEYWDAVHAGALKAVKEAATATKDRAAIDIELTWLPPTKDGDVAEQIRALQNVAGTHPDGVILAPLDPKQLRPPVEALAGTGIPVVAIDTPLSSPLIAAYVGSNNYQAGQEAAGLLGKLMGERGGVLVVGNYEQSKNIEQREKGFIQGLSLYPNVQPLFSGDYAAPVPAVLPEAVGGWLKQFGERVTGVFIADPAAYPGVAKAIEEARAGGRSKIIRVAFGSTHALIDAVRSGEIEGLLADNPFEIGYGAVQILAASLEGKRVQLQNTVADALVTAENLNDPTIKVFLNPPVAENLKSVAEAPAGLDAR